MANTKINTELDQKGQLNIYDNNDQMTISGYKYCRLKVICTWLAYLLSLGFLRLIFYWKPNWLLYCTHTKCDVEDAHKVLITDQYEQIFVEDIVHQVDSDSGLLFPLSNGQYKATKNLRLMINKKCRYIWDFEKKTFVKLTGLDFNGIQCDQLHQMESLCEVDCGKRLKLFGVNLIEINVQTLIKIFFIEVLSPFYIYQLFAIIFWAADQYYYYAGYIFVMSFISLAITTYQIQVNQKKLRDKMFGSTDVLVYRQSKVPNALKRINSSELVPGDVICLENRKCQLYCDAVLISGEVIVDESILTGESNPVTKTPLRNNSELYSHVDDSRHVLFCGTTVIQARQNHQDPVRAVVIKTNFQTVKGELVRSILYPKPIDFKFNRHINHFLCIMGVLALIGFIYTVVLKILRHDGAWEILFKAIDLITIVVPPELPAGLTIATIFAEKRLRKSKIFCLSPRSINISGCVDCVVFDKTGTLTENEVDLEEIVESNATNSAYFSKPIKQVHKLDPQNRLCQGIAVCHSLKLLDRQFIGETLEIQLFNSTKWTLHESKDSKDSFGLPVSTFVQSPDSKVKLAILKQYPFNSKSARMSVVIKDLNNPNNLIEFYIKGAPEVIVALCKPETVPTDFFERLNEYTQKSYRVLAIAYKQFTDVSIKDVFSNEANFYEQDLVFAGLVVMRNKLKNSTVDTIQKLNTAIIRSVMATGDNLMTALSVAKECNIIHPHDDVVILEVEESPLTSSKPKLKYYFHSKALSLPSDEENIVIGNMENNNSWNPDQCPYSYKLAMTGKTFRAIRQYYPQIQSQVMARCAVYARMAPEQKQQLVEMLQSIGYFVSMCGDGANDCGALKVGMSLSDTEASVASSFTCVTGKISCVVDMLREGRSSLMSAYCIVRYMACYNITTFLAICILYYQYSALTDIQNLYQDVAIITLYVFLFGRTTPFPKLTPHRMQTSLISLTQISSIIIQLTLVAVTQFSATAYLHSQPWFVKHNETSVDDAESKDYICHDNYAMFIIQVFQYVTLVVVFSKGAPFRSPIYKNRLLTLAIVITTLVTLFIVLTPEWPFDGIADFFNFEYEDFPMNFRLQLIGFNIIHFVFAIISEKYIVERHIIRLEQKYTKQPYEKIYEQTDALDWIPT